MSAQVRCTTRWLAFAVIVFLSMISQEILIDESMVVLEPALITSVLYVDDIILIETPNNLFTDFVETFKPMEWIYFNPSKSKIRQFRPTGIRQINFQYKMIDINLDLAQDYLRIQMAEHSNYDLCPRYLTIPLADNIVE